MLKRNVSSFIALFLTVVLTSFHTASADDFLPAEHAFSLKHQQTDTTLNLDWKITEGYYLYQKKLRVLANGRTILLSPPEALVIDDEYYGKTPVYHYYLSLAIDLSALPANTKELTVEYQGCAEAGLCYLLQRKIITLQPLAKTTQTETPLKQLKWDLNSDQTLLSFLQQGHWGLILLAFFGGGLLSAFAGCAYPMFPILSNIIIGQGANITRSRAFSLSLAYVLPMAFIYALLGVLAGIMGHSLTQWFQTPWALSITVAVLVAMALSMFGLFSLQLPSSIQSKLNQISQNQRGGTYLGAVIMGIISAFIVSACTVPPIVAGISFIAQTGHILQGAVAMFLFGLGLGLPLLLLGLSASWLLPKAGRWMHAIQIIMGFFLLSAAIYLLSRLFDNTIITALWSILLLGAALYFLFKTEQTILKILGLTCAVGTGVMLAGLLGNTQSSDTSSITPKSSFTYVTSLNNLQTRIEASKQPVLLDFYADWCSSCQTLKHSIYPAVSELLNAFTRLKVDLTESNDDKQAIMQHYGVYGPPAILLFKYNTQSGAFEEQRGLRVVGELSVEELQQRLNKVIGQP